MGCIGAYRASMGVFQNRLLSGLYWFGAEGLSFWVWGSGFLRAGVRFAGF